LIEMEESLLRYATLRNGTVLWSIRWLGRLYLIPLLMILLLSLQLLGQPSARPNQKPNGEETEKSQLQSRPPAFQNVRYEEDWSVLADQSTIGLDRIKHIPLNDSGSVFFSLGGQLRLRSESWWNFGFGGPGNRNDTFGLSRVRLHGDLHIGPHLRFFVEGKSSLSTSRELPGGRRILDVDTADFQNVLLEVNLPFESGEVKARLGRQELQFGKQRLVSPLDWSNTRRSWDGARGVVKTGGWQVDGFWSRFVQIKKYDLNCSPCSGIKFYGVYGTKNASQEFPGLDLYWLGYDRTDARFGGLESNEKRQTIGGRLGGDLGSGNGDFDLESAYQFGDFGDQNISALMFTGLLGYTFKESRLALGLHSAFDYASGDGDPTDDKLGTFNQLFPLGHAYLGFADVVGRQNIIDWSLGLAFIPYPKWKVRLDLHNFWRANRGDALYNPGGAVVRPPIFGADRRVGSEIDLTAGFIIDRHWNLGGGYSRFFAGPFISQTGPSKDASFLYFMVQSTF
jgi:hypothetical protein